MGKYAESLVQKVTSVTQGADGCINPLGDASHTQKTVKPAFPAMKVKQRDQEQIGTTGKGVSILGKN